MSGLLQLSGVVVDLVHRIDHLPAAGEEVEASTVMMAAGGGFNAMAAARRMGAEVTYGGTLGTGLMADLAEAAIIAEAIRLPALPRPPLDQGSCVVLVDARAERSFISHHGAERQIGPDHFDALDPAGHDWLLLTGYSLLVEPAASAFAGFLARLPAGPRLLFDPGPVVGEIEPGRLSAALARADWISANKREADILTGRTDPADAAAALAKGRQGAILRVGPDGCWLAGPEGAARHVPGFAVDSIDTNGAGDTHDGAFIAAMLSGLNPYEACVLANAAAALSTCQLGPATCPDLATARLFLDASAQAPRRAGSAASAGGGRTA